MKPFCKCIGYKIERTEYLFIAIIIECCRILFVTGEMKYTLTVVIALHGVQYLLGLLFQREFELGFIDLQQQQDIDHQRGNQQYCQYRCIAQCVFTGKRLGIKNQCCILHRVYF